MMVCRHHDVGDIIIFNGLHPLDTFSAAVLAVEIIRRHTFDITQLCRRNNRCFIRNQIFRRDIILIKSNFCPALVSVFFGNDLKFLFDDAAQLILIRQNFPELLNRNLKRLKLFFNLAALQTCQCPEAHIDNSLRLCIRKPEPLHELFFSFLDICRTADNGDNFINVVKRNQQSLQDMRAFFRFIQIIFGSSCDDVFLMDNIIR